MFSKAVTAINLWMARLSVAIIVVMMFGITADVFLRYLFNAPITGMVELCRTLLVIVVFFSIGFCQYRKRHIYAEFLVERLSGKRKILVMTLELILALVVMFIFAYGTVQIAYTSTMELEYEVGIMNFPVWPSRIAIALGLIALCLQYLSDIIGGFISYSKN